MPRLKSGYVLLGVRFRREAVIAAANVLILALQKEGVLASTRIYSSMPDGRALVETAVYPGKDGLPVMRTNYFKRAR